MPNPRIDGKAYSKALAMVVDRVRLLSASNSIIIRPLRLRDLEAEAARPAPCDLGVDKDVAPTPLNATEITAARKIILPLLVALDCALGLHGDTEECDASEDAGDGTLEAVDKTVIADALHRLVALWPDGNPPRAALKRVNEVLMSKDHM
jgi:tRNA A64-2'-O-ribosylphosphate transferase